MYDGGGVKLCSTSWYQQEASLRNNASDGERSPCYKTNRRLNGQKSFKENRKTTHLEKELQNNYGTKYNLKNKLVRGSRLFTGVKGHRGGGAAMTVGGLQQRRGAAVDEPILHL